MFGADPRAAPPGAPAPLRALDPRVRTLWHLTAAVGAAVGVLVATAVGLVAASAGWTVVAVLAGGAAVLMVVAAAVGPRLAYRRWSWTLTDDHLEVRHGLIVRVRSAIPTFRVQQVDVRQGPLERAFGVVTLQITTASAASDGVLPGIAAEQAEAVRREILARIAADDGV